ncbi:hypothetical protein DMB92_01560 [Campylobacter sp. MIT 99-7217]|uniref:hypothetical protein n=1 Tax=Campylobacter sp. MIT 99-7217 TaxID=535091 RepID=UPI001159F9A8|nr:hypothetical protein [Campylobacter sp. MIT 99-7217]TQR34673.1 hypothetical protein DMB92_01560 [Campylobacter sp. MIT 99-7217]
MRKVLIFGCFIILFFTACEKRENTKLDEKEVGQEQNISQNEEQERGHTFNYLKFQSKDNIYISLQGGCKELEEIKALPSNAHILCPKLSLEMLDDNKNPRYKKLSGAKVFLDEDKKHVFEFEDKDFIYTLNVKQITALHKKSQTALSQDLELNADIQIDALTQEENKNFTDDIFYFSQDDENFAYYDDSSKLSFKPIKFSQTYVLTPELFEFYENDDKKWFSRFYQYAFDEHDGVYSDYNMFLKRNEEGFSWCIQDTKDQGCFFIQRIKELENGLVFEFADSYLGQFNGGFLVESFLDEDKSVIYSWKFYFQDILGIYFNDDFFEDSNGLNFIERESFIYPKSSDDLDAVVLKKTKIFNEILRLSGFCASGNTQHEGYDEICQVEELDED